MMNRKLFIRFFSQYNSRLIMKLSSSSLKAEEKKDLFTQGQGNNSHGCSRSQSVNLLPSVSESC